MCEFEEALNGLHEKEEMTQKTHFALPLLAALVGMVPVFVMRAAFTAS